MFFHYYLFYKKIIPNGNEFRRTAGGRWTAWMNPKYLRIGTSSFPLSAEKSRKRCPSSRSYWRPLQNLSTIAFRWDFICSFFAYSSLTSSANWKTKKLPFGTTCRSSFIFHNGGWTISEQTTWWHRARKSVRHVFMFSIDRYKKIAPDAVQYCGLRTF